MIEMARGFLVVQTDFKLLPGQFQGGAPVNEVLPLQEI